MEFPIYKCEYPEHIKKLLKDMRDKIAQPIIGFGITLSGNRVTLRWRDEEGKLVSCHMIIEHVDDGHDFGPDEDLPQ